MSVETSGRRLVLIIIPYGTDLPCEYNCIFGISRPCQGIVPGGLHEVFRNGSSYLISGGQNGRVYWFRFEKLPQRLHGTQIPRYTQKDLEEALDRASNDPILPGLNFSELIENRITAVLTPLPEYVYKKWHFDRIFTLGDSAHKVTGYFFREAILRRLTSF